MTNTPQDDIEPIRIGTYFVPPNTPAWKVAAITEQVRREDQFQAERDAAGAAHDASPVAQFRAEVIDRALMRGQWHIDRCIERDIECPEAEAAETAFMKALHALGNAASYAEREAALVAAHEALSRWKAVLADMWDEPDTAQMDHCIELDQGELLTLLRCVATLDYLDSADARAAMTKEQRLLALAAELFACPKYPNDEI